MRLLLDTHVLLWVMADDPSLPSATRAIINKAEVVYVSAVSLWEISIKVGLGKLNVDQERLSQRLIDAGFEPLNITWSHAEAVRHLPGIHRDPFDRMLIAQAVSEPLKLMTADNVLAKYSDLVITV
jgi:PIN domain nuclease of toxin-antitoxin system